MIIIFGFGWAKPVRTNPSAYRNYYRDDFWVSIAGPIANFLTSILFTIIFAFFLKYVDINMSQNSAINVFNDMINEVITLNVLLGFFNLLPIPGFDGFHALKDLFRGGLNNIEEKLWQIRPLLLIGAVYFAGNIISAPANLVIRWLSNIVNLIVFS